MITKKKNVSKTFRLTSTYRSIYQGQKSNTGVWMRYQYSPRGGHWLSTHWRHLISFVNHFLYLFKKSSSSLFSFIGAISQVSFYTLSEFNAAFIIVSWPEGRSQRSLLNWGKFSQFPSKESWHNFWRSKKLHNYFFYRAVEYSLYSRWTATISAPSIHTLRNVQSFLARLTSVTWQFVKWTSFAAF